MLQRGSAALTPNPGDAAPGQAVDPRQHPLSPGVSFCVITKGGRDALLGAVLASIRAQRIPSVEIIVAGVPPNDPEIVSIEAQDAARAGRLGEMRNRAVAASTLENVVLMDDDIVLAPDWYASLCKEGPFDILTSRLHLPDGSRYWDHATAASRRGHAILNADEPAEQPYMTGGGAWVMTRQVARAVRWDPKRAFYEGEDLDFAARCRAQGFAIRHAPACWAVHLDGRCTQIGRRVHRRSGEHDARWVARDLACADALEVARCVQRLLKADQVAEACDALRFAVDRVRGSEPLREWWTTLEQANGGPLASSRFCAEGDPEVRAVLRGYGLDLEALLDARIEESLRAAPRPAVGVAGAPLAVNLFGYLSGNLGLGVAARAYLRLLRERGVEVCPVELEVGSGRAGHESRYLAEALTLGDATPHAVNLFVLDVPTLHHVLTAGYPAVQSGSRINASVLFWELTRLPESWVEVLERMDLVLAPSQFVAQTCMSRLSRVRVRSLPTPVFVDASAGANRARFGFSDDEVVFLTTFEMASDPARKNPWGAIEAFERAFPTPENARLVVKVNNASAEPEFAPHLDALLDRASRRLGLSVLSDVLPYSEVLSLYESADVLVSMHRAEGLGLPLLEAMALGRATIGTGWSGNTDFMTDDTSILLRYRLVPVEAQVQILYREQTVGREALWAEPCVEHAVRSMRRLAEDPDLRRALGERAATAVAARQASIDIHGLCAAVAEASRDRALPSS